MSELDRLAVLIARLRGPRGCPWDRKQTHRSLIRFLREESRELEKALRGGRPHDIEDELGDLLLNVFLHAQIEDEAGRSGIQDVARAQRLKLIRRHPHVFGRRKFKTAGDVRKNWATIKARERRLRHRDLALGPPMAPGMKSSPAKPS